MRPILAAMLFISSIGFAYALAAVPETDGFAAPAAIGMIGALAALIWERSRKWAK